MCRDIVLSRYSSVTGIHIYFPKLISHIKLCGIGIEYNIMANFEEDLTCKCIYYITKFLSEYKVVLNKVIIKYIIPYTYYLLKVYSQDLM